MEVKVRPDIGQLQGRDPERSEESENLMTFEDFLNSFDSEMQRLDEIDKDLPFTDDWQYTCQACIHACRKSAHL